MTKIDCLLHQEYKLERPINTCKISNKNYTSEVLSVPFPPQKVWLGIKAWNALALLHFCLFHGIRKDETEQMVNTSSWLFLPVYIKVNPPPVKWTVLPN